MQDKNSLLASRHLKLSFYGFFLFSPISILAFPITVLVKNPEESLFQLLSFGILLTASIFPIYMIFILAQAKLHERQLLLNIAIFFFGIATVGAFRGYFFHLILENMDLVAPERVEIRIMGSTGTTLAWLISSNLLVDYVREFRSNYEKALRSYFQRNVPELSQLAPSQNSKSDLANLQSNFVKSVNSIIQEHEEKNISSFIDELKNQINSELRSISQRIWIRSLDKYPSFHLKQLIRDSIEDLRYSRGYYFAGIGVLAFANNLVIRDFNESAVRTGSFLIVLALVELFEKRFKDSNNYLFLLSIGLFPVISSEFLANLLNYEGSWTATFLIAPVAPAILVASSMFILSQRDQQLIIEFLESDRDKKSLHQSGPLHVGDRNLASYLHNSLQSELLSIVSSLEDAVVKGDRQRSEILIKKLASIAEKPFIEKFEKFSQDPLDRLSTLIESWAGVLDINVEISEKLLLNTSKSAIIVQTIEEFAANSFRHGAANRVNVRASLGSKGVLLELTSNGTRPTKGRAGLGTKWLDQVALDEWSFNTTPEGATLTLEV